jgi:glutamyl-Q tRNA(Asp) synthetase
MIPDTPYVGRFAPSPTGPLHLGSLVAALASWLDARSAAGRWLVRIEDLDKPREQPGAAAEILRQLEALGLDWDGEVVYQSTRPERYRAALDELKRRGLTYPCACSRREIADSMIRAGAAGSLTAADGARIYPGTCRNGMAPGRSVRAIRLRTEGVPPMRLVDRIQGELVQRVEQEVGDFVLQRADGVFAYQLAVVVDDAAQGVTDVVRGADLLDSTGRQMLLQRFLGAPSPRYAHVPALVNSLGEKLSKQTGASPLDCAHLNGHLCRALELLGHPPPPRLAGRELLAWARAHWDMAQVPRARTIVAA